MKQIIFILGAVLLIVAACQMTPSPKNQSEKKWGSRMQELSQVLATLLPFVVSRNDFNDEKNYAAIEANTKHLSELAHAVNTTSHSESPDTDPAVGFLAKNFESDISKAYDGLKTGHRDYSRQVLMVVTNHCIACHSRNQIGPQFEQLNSNIDYKNLNPFVKAEVYAATRQFHLAIDEYHKIILNRENLTKYPFEVERSLKKALALQVRVFNNPKKSMVLVDEFLAQSDVPHFLGREAKVWAEDLKKWDKEGKSKSISKSGYKKAIEKLIVAAQARQNSFDRDEPFINYLRATGLGHEYLAKYHDDKSYPEVLLNMGICYEYLQDLGYWTLNEDYYRQCIHDQPHTELAMRCYNRLEQSIYLGYTGSSGTNLPPDVRTQLKEFKELAVLH